MRNQKLDEMPIAEVFRCAERAATVDAKAYWLRVASVKISEYRRFMPRLARFVPDANWRGTADAAEKQLKVLSDSLPTQCCGEHR